MGTTRFILCVLVPLAYLVGAVPFGLIVGLARGVDPRKAGSGNIGATNVGRLLGARWFAVVFALDVFKGLLPAAAASIVVHRACDAGAVLHWFDYALWLLAGFAAIVGHMFPVYIGFRGGKGVATGAGVMLGLFPYFTLPGALCVAVWAAVFAMWRYVSLASMCGAAAFPAAYACIGLALRWPVFSTQLPLLASAIAIAGLVIFRHRDNISRLRAGTEHAFGRPAQAQSPPSESPSSRQ